MLRKYPWFKSWQLYVLLLPSLVYLLIMCYSPMYGIIVAFKDYIPALGISESNWVGFDNFTRFFESYYFGMLLKNTLTISVYSLLVNMPIPIILALLINEVRNGWFKKSVQTISYAPYFVSVVVVVGMCFSFLNPDTGIINRLLSGIGLTPVAFMGEGGWFKTIYVLSGLWQGAGWWAIIYVATLSGVDESLHEAATIDGAGRLKRIIHINIPALIPTIVVILIMNVGNIMNVGFEKVYLMQNQMNIQASDIISTYTYRVGLGSSVKDFGFATAVGLFNSVVNLVLLFIANITSKKAGQESLW